MLLDQPIFPLNFQSIKLFLPKYCMRITNFNKGKNKNIEIASYKLVQTETPDGGGISTQAVVHQKRI